MNNLLNDLITFALEKNTTDIHFVLQHNVLKIEFRTQKGLEEIIQDIWTPQFFEYLKFISRFDITNPYLPQSGQFVVNGETMCRFSVITNQGIQTGVLRILNKSMHYTIQELSHDKEALQFFKSIQHLRSGLFIHAGPTNSGKTTTVHAILSSIRSFKEHKIVSLEDPIEIEDSSYLQLQINEAQGFTYEKGIEELLRHDPDVIFIGETRNAYTAKMLVRAALTGHLVFTTIHAKNGLETLQRLYDFGIEPFELKNVLSGIVSQRLYSNESGKECVYEILKGDDLQYALENGSYPQCFKTLCEKTRQALDKKWIEDDQANYDIQGYNR